MQTGWMIRWIAAIVVVLSAGWLGFHAQAAELAVFPANDSKGLITTSGVTVDKGVSSDGKGSLKIEATEPRVVRLYETGDLDVEKARLIYRAAVRTEKLQGRVYLEMWCRFPDKGEYFSRGLNNVLTGTTKWTTLETPFFLKAGQNPDNVKLNLVIEGKGTVWIDDIKVLKAPL